MTSWQPDWTALETSAVSVIASSPLAAQIASVTPVGGYVAIGLQTTLTDVLTAAAKDGRSLDGVMAIAVDTLVIPAGETVISAPGVEIIARAVVVDGSASVIVRSDGIAGLQLTANSIAGSLSIGFQSSAGGPIGSPVALPALDQTSPTVLTVSAGQPLTTSGDTTAVADILKEPWAIVALEVSSAIAGVLLDEGDPSATAYAAEMLRWVTGGTGALIAQRAQIRNVDFTNVASLQSNSIGLLVFTQAALSGASYVPVLAAATYQSETAALLAVARTYDAKITGLQSQSGNEQALREFATTLGAVYSGAEAPLLSSLQRLAAEAGVVQAQVQNAAVQLSEICASLPALQNALTHAIEEEFQRELVTMAVEILATIAELYVGAAASIVGDPELLAGKAGAILKVALENAAKVIEKGGKGLDSVISDGMKADWSAPSAGTAKEVEDGGASIAASLSQFGVAVNVLWKIVNTATSGTKINLSPDLLAALDSVPDLSGFSIGGLDPVTYWNTVVINTQTSIKPNEKLPEARAYLAAVQLAAAYGAAVGDGQLKLLDLYTQGMAAFDRLQEVYQAEAKWTSLSASLDAEEAQLEAAIGLLNSGYLNVKRSLVLANQSYRSAFAYQWLTSSTVEVDVTMDLVQLENAVASSVTGLEHVLIGTQTGVRPAQAFRSVPYRVQRDGLFREVDGKGQAQWSIAPGDPLLSGALSGNTAIFLTSATFVLVGAAQSGEVELDVSTSGHYQNRLDSTDWRFVSQPVSMTNDYQPSTPPEFVTQWSFADAAAYLKPSPYTDWTLRVDQGNWADATAIDVVFSGIFLQNR